MTGSSPLDSGQSRQVTPDVQFGIKSKNARLIKLLCAHGIAEC